MWFSNVYDFIISLFFYYDLRKRLYIGIYIDKENAIIKAFHTKIHTYILDTFNPLLYIPEKSFPAD